VGTVAEYCSVQTLVELRERRAYECRLTPDRALSSLDEAEAFLLDRGLLTRTTDSALPSLYEALHEEAYRAGSGGFGDWSRTKWPWFGELAERGHVAAAVHRGKNLLVSSGVAALLDPICRAEIDRLRAADPEWRRLIDHLAEAGPSSLEDLQTELELKPKELKLLRSPLERCGAVVARSLQTAGEGHAHSSELALWDHVFSSSGDVGVHLHHSLRELVVAGVRAAVVAPERELRRWFSWQWYWQDELVEDLIRAGRLRRVDEHVAVGD
jgi:hypothetical protein